MSNNTKKEELSCSCLCQQMRMRRKIATSYHSTKKRSSQAKTGSVAICELHSKISPASFFLLILINLFYMVLNAIVGVKLPGDILLFLASHQHGLELIMPWFL
uniref:Uncharacterized protein n=1 Tax=Arundo donax TaxID=35708 RepID=A0A0A9DAE5_ARUDO